YLFSIYFEHIDLGQFTEQFTFWTDPKDYIIGATKALVFGLTLSVAACYQGVNVRGGAKEGGRAATNTVVGGGAAKGGWTATTSAVVGGSVSILVSDYVLIDAFHILWPYKS